MGQINPTYNNRVRYILSHTDYGTLTITEPIGWRTDEKELARHKTYHGIFAQFSNSLKFVNDGAEYITLIYDLYGINAQIRLIRDEQHPHTDLWTRTYEGFLDLSTYSIQDGQVSVKFNASGLEQLIKSRENEKVEIERLDTIDGNELPELNPQTVRLDGRRIFLESLLEVKEADKDTVAFDMRFGGGNDRTGSLGIPVSVTYKSDEHIHSILKDVFTANPNEGSAAVMFYLNNDREKRLDITIDLDSWMRVEKTEDLSNEFMRVVIAKFKNGSDLNIVNRTTVYEVPSVHTDHHIVVTNFKTTITLLEGESLSLQWYGGGKFGRGLPVPAAGVLREHFNDTVCTLKIEEDSVFEPSDSKMVLAHELGQRLTTILTNRDKVFYSEALGRTDIGYAKDGKDTGALTGFAHGFWVRKFDKEPQDEDNKYKGITTSFKDYIEALSVMWNLGLGIERIGFNERVRIEDLSYFYTNNTTIKLPFQVNKLKRGVTKDYFYSGIEIGYAKGGEYEEAMGLDEYNAKSTFTTVINRIEKVFKKVAKYRADVYGLEFARRKPIEDFRTEDTRYDKDIFALDLKRLGSDYGQRKWQDDFVQAPKNVFSPETATNLRFSPFNLLLRHGWIIASGLTKYPMDYVRYGSSTANSRLITQLSGGNEYAENGTIINTELSRARYIPETVEFEHIVDFDVARQLDGFTTLFGKKTPNVYGLVEFINETGEKEKGFLLSVKPNGSGKWKLLKANR